jgi:hypothetical protein
VLALSVAGDGALAGGDFVPALVLDVERRTVVGT